MVVSDQLTVSFIDMLCFGKDNKHMRLTGTQVTGTKEEGRREKGPAKSG